MNPMSNTRLLYLSFYVQAGMTRSANHLKLRISHFLGTRRLLATLLRLPQIFATSVGNNCSSWGMIRNGRCKPMF